MTMFTVVTKKRVLRVRARSVQHLQRTLRAVGIEWIGIDRDREDDE